MPSPAARSQVSCGVFCFLKGTFNFLSPILEFFLPISVLWLVLWLVFRPNNVRPRVDAAVLTQFNLTNAATSTLDYDITMDLSFHNSHNHLSVRYFDLTAVASYGGTRLGPSVDVLPVFVQRPKASNVFHVFFQGSSAGLAPAAAEVFVREVADGSFNVLVTVTSTFMYKILFQKQDYYYKHECNIRFPAPQSGTPATVSSPGTVCISHSR